MAPKHLIECDLLFSNFVFLRRTEDNPPSGLINAKIAQFLSLLFSLSGVSCSDTVEGAQCGPCPHGYEGDGKTCHQRRNPCHDNPCASGTHKDIHVIAT